MKNDYNTDDTQIADDSVAALLAFMRKFPEHSSNNLYLTGKSYAGHYVPTLAKTFWTTMPMQRGFQTKINIVRTLRSAPPC